MTTVDDDDIEIKDILDDKDYNIFLKNDETIIFDRLKFEKDEGMQDIIFYMPDQTEFIRLCNDGKIKIKGIVVDNDKELVQAMRDFLSGINPNYKDTRNIILPTRMCFDVERFGNKRNQKEK